MDVVNTYEMVIDKYEVIMERPVYYIDKKNHLRSYRFVSKIQPEVTTAMSF